MKKKYVSFTAALAAAVLCSGAGSVLAAGVTLEVTDPSQITSGGDWQENENQIYAPGGPGLSGGNQLHLSGDGTWSRVAGGYGIGAVDNTVNVDRASGLSSMYGGYTDSAGEGANRNTLNLNESAFSVPPGKTGTISGGYAAVTGNGDSAAADKNAVNLSDVTIGSSYKVYGGYSKSSSGEANENAVDMTGGTMGLSSQVYGGFAQAVDSRGSAATNRNAVSLTGVNAQSSNSISGSSATNDGGGSAEANGNAVSLNGATMGKATIWGGMAQVTKNASDGTCAETIGNMVDLTNVTLGASSSIYGGKALIRSSGNAAANKNVVSLNHVTLGRGSKVYGGHVFAAGDAAASENTVHIYGSLSAEDAPAAVYGGYADGSGEAQDNEIILHDGTDAAVYADLYGSNGTGDGYTGNALILDNWSGNVNSVQNFDEITFQNIRWQTGGTVLDITDNSQTDALKDTTIHLDSISFAGGTELQTGGSMTFIEGDNLGIQEGNVDVADTRSLQALPR